MSFMNPAKLSEVQTLTKDIRGEILVDYPDDSIHLKLASANPQAQQVIPGFLEELSNSLAKQLWMVFQIGGGLEERGKPTGGQ